MNYQVRLGRFHIPLIKPFVTALRTVHHLEDFVLQVTDGTHFGFGSATPTPKITGDTEETIRTFLQVFQRTFEQRIPVSLEQDLQVLHQISPYVASARAAAEIALYDFWVRRAGVPLRKFLSNVSSRKALLSDCTVSVGSTESMVQEAQDAVSRGFSSLKVKIGKNPDQEIRALRSMHQRFPNVALRLDANQGWDLQTTLQIMKTLEAENLPFEFLEQPVPAKEVEWLKQISSSIRTPVVADEALFTISQAHVLLESRAAQIWSVKLAKSGGIGQAMEILTLAHQHHIPCLVSCMMESVISVSAAAHVASAFDNVRYIDLDPPFWVAASPVRGGCTFSNGTISFSDAPGLGIQSLDCEWFS